jgi:hypothetical protein
MVVEQPYKGRAIIEETISGLSITIPAKRKYHVIVFFIIWLAGWTIGGGFALRMVLLGNAQDAQGFLIAWLCGWAYGELSAISILVWMFIGKEVITIDRGILTIRKKGSLFSRPKLYKTDSIEALRVDETLGDNVFGRKIKTNSFASLFGKAIIGFDYGKKTVSFGGDIKRQEAEYIVSVLKDKRLINN